MKLLTNDVDDIFVRKCSSIFFFYFQVAICSVPIRKYNIVSSTLKRWRRKKKNYLNRKYLVMMRIYLCTYVNQESTDMLWPTIWKRVFFQQTKKTLRSLKRRKVWQRFAGWCDDNYIYAFAIYGEETICSTHLHTALQGMILYAFLALIHTAI